MTTLLKAAQQVLGVLIDAQLHNYALQHDCTDALIVSLRTALEQQAWVCPESPEHRYAKPGHCEDCGRTLVRAQQAEHFCDTHCTWADHAPGCVRAEPVGTVRVDAGEVHIIPAIRDADRSALKDGQAVYAAPPRQKVQEPVAWLFEDTLPDEYPYDAMWPYSSVRGGVRMFPVFAPPQRKPLTDEEILEAVGWERAEMYMKLTPNFPVEEARKETLKNARAVEAKHGIKESP